MPIERSAILVSAVFLAVAATLAVLPRAEADEMSSEKDLARQAIEMWAGDATIDTSIFAAGYQNHQEPKAAGGRETIDLESWASLVASTHTTFPDLKVEILAQIGEEDRIATYWRFAGTQTGAYLDHPATGRAAEWTGVQIDRIAGGRIAESWVTWDFYSLLRDLGLDMPQ